MPRTIRQERQAVLKQQGLRPAMMQGRDPDVSIIYACRNIRLGRGHEPAIQEALAMTPAKTPAGLLAKVELILDRYAGALPTLIRTTLEDVVRVGC